ncbi:hypothetical protein MNBD_GAMMA12-3988 [hydrothermal vent metagenome]|uniref:Uncharacterized protein n=1 Tax=hydrothermal vent metagenome TaxID=652676 RepID=A0A3B0Z390_9ZZZZ
MVLNMEFIRALTLSLGEIKDPVITSYRLGLIIHLLYQTKQYKTESIDKIKKDYADKQDFNRHLHSLLNEGILDKYRSLPSSVYTLLGRTTHSTEDVCCTIDPFCYVSHLSAMEYHGLSNRLPVKLYLSSPSTKKWTEYAKDKMKKDLKDSWQVYIDNKMPKLLRTELKKISKKEIHRFGSLHLGAYKAVQDRTMRVATIGRTFLDMLRNPELCGGINHVLEVYTEHAEAYTRLITDEIEQHGTAIDKVRAGYIFDERLKIKNNVVESWTSYAQRGGSRKLDASSEYIPKWSDKWSLSLNVFE